MPERMFRADGLVLRTRPLGEADRLVTLLTREEGKFEAVAKGARKMKSKLAAGVDIFSYGHYTFHRGKTWPVITSQDSIEQFTWFRDNPALYPYGIYMGELVDRLVSGEEPCNNTFNLLLESWKLLGSEVDSYILCRSFELKLAHLAGYSPHFHSCSACGSLEAAKFSPRQGGMLCNTCSRADVIAIDKGIIAIVERLISAPLSQAHLVRLSAEQKRTLSRVTSAFLTYHLDLGDIKSRSLLKEYNA